MLRELPIQKIVNLIKINFFKNFRNGRKDADMSIICFVRFCLPPFVCLEISHDQYNYLYHYAILKQIYHNYLKLFLAECSS